MRWKPSGYRLGQAVAALAATIMTLGAAAAEQGGDVIKIGVVSPLSGASSRYGAYAVRGAALAVDEINGAGGVLGKKLELVQGDSQCVPAEGVSATQRMIRFDNVSMIIGDVCSSVTLAMQPVVEQAGVLLINAASSNPEITSAVINGRSAPIPQTRCEPQQRCSLQ